MNDKDNEDAFYIPGYILANNNRYYKYNLVVLGTYYCEGGIIIKYGEPIEIGNPESKILVDNFLVDVENKTIRQYEDNTSMYYYDREDSFLDGFNNIEKISIEKNNLKGNEARRIIIQKKYNKKPIIIGIDKSNQIISYTNEEITEIGDNFLQYNYKLEELNLPNAKKIGAWFLERNNSLKQIYLPKVEEVEVGFIPFNSTITKVDMPKLVKMGRMFLQSCSTDFSKQISNHRKEIEER